MLKVNKYGEKNKANPISKLAILFLLLAMNNKTIGANGKKRFPGLICCAIPIKAIDKYAYFKSDNLRALSRATKDRVQNVIARDSVRI
jgi:hypothetical protein